MRNKKMKYNISIWTVQWVELDEDEKLSPVVEIHLSFNSAMKRVSQMVDITPEEYTAMRGYKVRIVSPISMSEIEI
jgi:hypothetical protein